MSKPTLESVALAFEEWRNQRKNQIEHIPERLWAMAIRLYPQHKRTHICRRLGLCGGDFKQRIDGIGGSKGGFVLATTTVEASHAKPNAEVVLGIQGQQRTLTLKVTVDALSQVLPHIEALL
jgi:hypothetical protein